MAFSKPFHGNPEVTISYRSEKYGGRLPVYIFKDKENQSYMRLKVYNTHKYTALKEKTKGFDRKQVDEEGNFTCNVLGFYWDLCSLIWKI